MPEATGERNWVLIAQTILRMSYRVRVTEEEHRCWSFSISAAAKAFGIKVTQMQVKKTDWDARIITSKRKECRWMQPILLTIIASVSLKINSVTGKKYQRKKRDIAFSAVFCFSRLNRFTLPTGKHLSGSSAIWGKQSRFFSSSVHIPWFPIPGKVLSEMLDPPLNILSAAVLIRQRSEVRP